MDKELRSSMDTGNDPDKDENVQKDITNSLNDSKAEAKESEENNIEAEKKAADFNEMAVDEDNNAALNQISNDVMENGDSQTKVPWKKRFLRIRSGLALTVLCLAGIGIFFGCTKPGNMLLLKMGINFGSTIWGSMTNDFNDSKPVSVDVDSVDEEDLASDAPEVDTSTINFPSHPGNGRHEDGVYNILLLGEEALGMGNGRGHTDVMVIATLNTKDKTVKLTSLMRDMLVQIPGYKENKLNVAYAEGGLDLLYETIALNFNIKLDGCVKVDFQNFEKIIDDIGGLDLTLKSNEAYYLNHTNYVSNPKYRNLVVGKQHMNGNQVLGYARVRKTSTITGQNNDYGRTDRHRIVLNAIYEKCKTKSKTDLVYLMFKFLPMITTDIDNNCFQQLLNSYVDMGMSSANIQQLRIPADGTFNDKARVRGMAVIIPDYQANIDILHKFIFGDVNSDTSTSPDGTTTPSNPTVSGNPTSSGNPTASNSLTGSGNTTNSNTNSSTSQGN